MTPRSVAVFSLLLFIAVDVLDAGPRTSPQDRRRSTFVISGQVVLDDGRPFPEPVEVLMLCGGAVWQKVFSQAGGQFSFQLAENKTPSSGMSDTAGSPSGGGFRNYNRMGRGMGDDGAFGSGRTSKFGRINLSDCEITARLPGFSSQVVYPGSRDVMDNPDVGSLVLKRTARVSGTTVSVKSFSVPSKARKHFQKAMEEMGKEKVDHSKAAKELGKAVSLHQDYAAAWYRLGQCRISMGDQAGAREAFQKSVSADPEYLLPYLGIAELHMQKGEFIKAGIWSRRAIKRNSEVMRACYMYAYANYSLGNLTVAEEYGRRVQESDQASAYPGTHYLLGAILASKGDPPGAALEFRRYLELDPTFGGAAEIKRQLAEWKQKGLIQDGKQ